MAIIVNFYKKVYKPITKKKCFVYITSMPKKEAFKKSELMRNLNKILDYYDNSINELLESKKKYKFKTFHIYTEKYYHKNCKTKIRDGFLKLWHNLYSDKNLTKLFLKKGYKELPKNTPKKLYYLTKIWTDFDDENKIKNHFKMINTYTVAEVALKQGIELMELEKKLEKIHEVFSQEWHSFLSKKIIALKRMPKDYSVFDSVKELKQKYNQ